MAATLQITQFQGCQRSNNLITMRSTSGCFRLFQPLSLVQQALTAIIFEVIAMCPSTPYSPHREKSLILRLWFAWCMALLLALAAPAQAAVTSGTVTFSAGTQDAGIVPSHGLVFSGVGVGIGKGWTFDGSVAANTGYSGVSGGIAALEDGNYGPYQPGTGCIVVQTPGDKFNVGSVKMLSDNANTLITVNGYLGSTLKATESITVLPANKFVMEKRTLTINEVDKVCFTTDQDWGFYIDDLEPVRNFVCEA